LAVIVVASRETAQGVAAETLQVVARLIRDLAELVHRFAQGNQIDRGHSDALARDRK
jgi:hypothetical protein